MACQSCGNGQCAAGVCLSCAPSGLGAVMGDLRGRMPARNLILADRIDVATRAAPGQVVQGRLNSIPLVDNRNRIAHVTGIHLRGTVQVDAVGASMPGPYPARKLAGLFENIFIEEVGGHQYLASVTGQDVIDDCFARGYRVPMPPEMGILGGVIPAADATDLQIPIQLYFPFTRRDWHGPLLEGCVPLAALTCRGEQAFRFRIGTALPPDASGLTYDGFVGTIQMWVEVVYLPALYISRPWQYESYTLTDLAGSLRHCERCHEYVWIRKHWQDDAGSLDVAGYEGLTLQVDGQTIFSGLDQNELNQRTRYFARTDPDSEANSWARWDEVATVPGIGNLPLDEVYLLGADAIGQQKQAIILLPQTRRFEGAGCGLVTYQISSRGSDTNTRFLHRTVQRQTRQRAAAFRGSLGLPPSPAVAVDQNGNVSTMPSPDSSIVVVPENLSPGSTPVSARVVGTTATAGTAMPESPLI